MKKVTTFVLAENASGEFVFLTYLIEVSQNDYDEGCHYRNAEALAEQDGFEPTAAFDEFDPAGKQLRGLTSANRVPVANWDSSEYGGSLPDTPKVFAIAINDQRQKTGQVTIDIEGDTDNLDDTLYCSLEVNRLPGSSTDTQCLHLHFDGDNLAASFFKQGDKYIVRPECDVKIMNTTLPNGEHAWILE